MASRQRTFEETTSSWSTYSVRLEAYFAGHGVTDPAKSGTLLVSSLSDNVVRILQGRCQLGAINSLTYKVVVSHLEDCYIPKVNAISPGYSLFTRTQNEGENTRDFITNLRRLAKDCNFGETLNRMLRNRIVCGLRDDDARRFLLARKRMSLEEAEDFAILSETAGESIQAMRKTASHDGVGGTHFVRACRSNQCEAGSRVSCWRCDAYDSADKCRHSRTVCHRCGKKDHSARTCKSGRTNQERAYALADSDKEVSGEHMLSALVAHSSTKKDVVLPMEEDWLWEGRKLRMLVDTGSRMSLIPMSVLKKHRKWRPALEKTLLCLSCFLGPLPVVGIIAMKIQEHGQALVNSTLVIVDCQGLLLWGRNTIHAFHNAGLSILDVGLGHSVNIVHAEAFVPKLLEELADIFEEKLGCIKGPLVKQCKKRRNFRLL